MQTLEQLKQQNQSEEEANAVQEEQVDEQEAEEDVGLEDEEDNAESEADEQTEDDEAEEANEEVALWMQDEDGESDTVPVKAHAKMRNKLKAKLHDKEDELEILRAENERLKSGATQQPVQKRIVRPTLEQYEYDEDKYNEALDDYFDQKMEAKLSVSTSTREQAKSAQRQAEETQKSVDGHYDRAAKLIEDNGIDEEIYRKADESVRSVVEAVFPKRGDVVTDGLISRLGEGSEKVMYALGRNKSFQDEFKASLLADDTGIQAAILLGKKAAEFSLPAKRKTKAPAPAAKPKGDGGHSAPTEAKLKRRYQAAHKAKNANDAFKARREAKKAGIDVSKW